jgi:hypothetical protein
MVKLVIGTLLLMLAVGAVAVAVKGQEAVKLPKCSNQICKPDCSADTLCVRGASVVTCADHCGGH